MDIIKTIELTHWREFTKLKKKLCSGEFIFRGHSNGYDNSLGVTDEWKINSSYKRYLENTQISFQHFIQIYLNERLFNMHFNIYKYSKTKSLINSTLIEKLYFFQHYGLPTCFIDFTKDPFYALFFAISGIKIPIVRSLKNNRPATFSDNHFFTVLQLHLKTLIENFGVQSIINPDIAFNYSQYSLRCFGFKKIKQLVGKDKAKNIEVECYLDSEFVERQMTHQYKVKEPELQKLFIEVWNLMLDFGKVSFRHIPREKNKIADKLVNQALDEKERQIKLI